MNLKKILPSMAIAAIALTSCSGGLKELSSDYFNVTPNPLVADAGTVDATINGLFPEKYMNKKAVVTVTPQLRTSTGKTYNGTPATFQGEKVEENNQTISYKLGGKYTMKTSFQYVPDMLQSELYLTFDARVGSKSVDVPAVKVADGVVATSALAGKTVATAAPSIAPDAFQRVVSQKQEANIKFLIQQANLRSSELKSQSVQDFIALLKKINEDKEGYNVEGIEVSAYASPDGGLKINEPLAGKRKDVTKQYVEKALKDNKLDADIDANYTAEDWDGFQQLVKASNLQDKEVILNVLSMYKDPEEREQQIRNLSQGFQDLATQILPELRRSRLTIHYETIGRDDEQILSQMSTDASKLSLEELLYGASLYDNAAQQEQAYKKIIELYPDDYRAYNNVAACEYAQGNAEAAKRFLTQALAKNPQAQEPAAIQGLIALKEGNTAGAQNLIAKAAGLKSATETLGNLHLMQGNYAQAERELANTASNSQLLAQIMNKNYAGAAQTLKEIAAPDATTDYLKAVLNARQGNNAAAAEALKAAIAKDASYAAYAAKDIELKNVQK